MSTSLTPLAAKWTGGETYCSTCALRPYAGDNHFWLITTQNLSRRWSWNIFASHIRNIIRPAWAEQSIERRPECRRVLI